MTECPCCGEDETCSDGCTLRTDTPEAAAEMEYDRQREHRIAELEAQLAECKKQKNGAYTERDRLVAVLSKLLPAHLERHPDADTEWENDWRWIVVIVLPTGQASWHIHDSELAWFNHLEHRSGNTWDGHSTEEKYRRLSAIDTARDEGEADEQ